MRRVSIQAIEKPPATPESGPLVTQRSASKSGMRRVSIHESQVIGDGTSTIQKSARSFASSASQGTYNDFLAGLSKAKTDGLDRMNNHEAHRRRQSSMSMGLKVPVLPVLRSQSQFRTQEFEDQPAFRSMAADAEDDDDSRPDSAESFGAAVRSLSQAQKTFALDMTIKKPYTAAKKNQVAPEMAERQQQRKQSFLAQGRSLASASGSHFQRPATMRPSMMGRDTVDSATGAASVRLHASAASAHRRGSQEKRSLLARLRLCFGMTADPT